MKILINYQGAWRNSFLDGDNNNASPKKGRNYIASGKSLGASGGDNFIERNITHDTVMGVLNRLIGDRRKLYQARSVANNDYYFRDLEAKVSFDDKVQTQNNEVVYLRNMKRNNFDQNSFTGIIKLSDPLLTSPYSKALFGILAHDFETLCDIINVTAPSTQSLPLDPLMIADAMTAIAALKPIPVGKQTPAMLSALAVLSDYVAQQEGKVAFFNAKGAITPLPVYCSALYLQLSRLARSHDVSGALTKLGKITGFCFNGFTRKDFINRFTTGSKKPIYGNPYLVKRRIKGQGEVTFSLIKASGRLDITLDLPAQQARELKTIIHDAGVTTFVLGKKGLAYVHNIII